MTLISTKPLPAQNAARAELARTKRAATVLLALAFVTALIARAMQHLHPALGFVAAFAEAATVGGLADWFAVVALFRRPLGLPIPHTAIIPANRHRIATSLGEFVQVHFLGAEVIAAKLRSIDFVDIVRRWLEVPRNSAGLAQTILRLLPQFTRAFEHSGGGAFALRFVRGQGSRIDFAPFAADFIDLLISQGHHRQLFDAGLAGIATLLSDKGTLETIRAKIKEELPALFNFFRADAILLNRIVTSTFALTEEIRSDPGHPLRAEFDAFLQKFARDLRDKPQTYSQTIRDFAETIGSNPELGNILTKLFAGLMEAIREGARESSSQLTLSLDACRGRRRGRGRAASEGVFERGRRDRAGDHRRAAQERHLPLHLGSGRFLGHEGADLDHRGECRARSATYPVQRHDHRRPRRPRAAQSGVCGAAVIIAACR
jgi:uncharacterized membrane-anchored protein YjiN (DUF445 family)